MHTKDTAPEPGSAWPEGAMTYYSAGYQAGLEAGRAQAEAELSAIQRAAHRVVQAAAKMPTHADAVAARRRRQDEAAKQWRAA